jgi:hypothetical protein
MSKFGLADTGYAVYKGTGGSRAISGTSDLSRIKSGLGISRLVSKLPDLSRNMWTCLGIGGLVPEQPDLSRNRGHVSELQHLSRNKFLSRNTYNLLGKRLPLLLPATHGFLNTNQRNTLGKFICLRESVLPRNYSRY